MPVAQETKILPKESASATSEPTEDSLSGCFSAGTRRPADTAQRSPKPWPWQGSSDPLTHWGVQSSIQKPWPWQGSSDPPPTGVFSPESIFRIKRPWQGSSDPSPTGVFSPASIFRIKSLSLSRHEACLHTLASRRAWRCTLQPNAVSVPTKREKTKPPLTHRALVPHWGGHDRPEHHPLVS